MDFFAFNNCNLPLKWKTKSDEIDVNFEWEKNLRFELKQNYTIVTLCKV